AAGCTDPNFDDANCGTCGTACTGSQICQYETCAACPTGTTFCSGQCVDTTSDVNNCGACAKACAGTAASCASSACSTAATVVAQGAPFGIVTDGVNLYWTD